MTDAPDVAAPSTSGYEPPHLEVLGTIDEMTRGTLDGAELDATFQLSG